MSISSSGSSLVAAATNVSSGSSVSKAVSAAAREASETPQVTAKEAQQGDPVAKRKLLQMQAKQRLQQQQ